MVKSKVASIRALQELEGIVKERCSAKYSPLLKKAENDCTKLKTEISKQIEKEIEEYAVAKYAQYGLAIIPLCHRSSNYKDSDVVRPELRVKVFDQSAEVDYQKLKEEHRAALKKIDDWYFSAVQAVAAQVDLPPTPEF